VSTHPVVGITAYDVDATFGGSSERASLVPGRYVRNVMRAGGAPVLVPAGADARSLVARLDALVLSGGPDVDPARYGEEPHQRTRVAEPGRDEGEAALLAAALHAGTPVLAICRGMQLTNVVHGGTLHQHLPDVVGSDLHLLASGAFGRNTVDVAAGSALHAALGSRTCLAACHHHQAVSQVGAGLVAVAWSADGSIEALESDRGLPLIAVQWHPEEVDDPELFDWVVGLGRAAGRG